MDSPRLPWNFEKWKEIERTCRLTECWIQFKCGPIQYNEAVVELWLIKIQMARYRLAITVCFEKLFHSMDVSSFHQHIVDVTDQPLSYSIYLFFISEWTKPNRHQMIYACRIHNGYYGHIRKPYIDFGQNNVHIIACVNIEPLVSKICTWTTNHGSLRMNI